MNGKRGRTYQRQRPLKENPGSLICMCGDRFVPRDDGGVSNSANSLILEILVQTTRPAPPKESFGQPPAQHSTPSKIFLKSLLNN
jgi:hypothetical protein